MKMTILHALNGNDYSICINLKGHSTCCLVLLQQIETLFYKIELKLILKPNYLKSNELKITNKTSNYDRLLMCTMDICINLNI